MAPNEATLNGVLFEHEANTEDYGLDTVPVQMADKRKFEIVWKNIIRYSVIHLAASYGGYLFFTSAKWQTDAFAFLLYVMSALGMTAGAHRLWSHKSYKAKWPLRVILIIFNTLTFQDSVFDWARNHRMHHKYCDTDADPHNSTRGFFFCHIGWTLVRKHPELIRKAKDNDMSDLRADPIVMFQKNHYIILQLLINCITPTAIPMYFWNETWSHAVFVAVFFRLAMYLHATFYLNSAGHIWGNKPYDKLINPTENLMVNIVTIGEGNHNYHHTFPWDYRATEFGWLNFPTHFINFFSKIGWAYDLKTVSDHIIRKRIKRTGDGTHAIWGREHKQ